MKKYISVFLSVCLILSMLVSGFVAVHAEGNTIEGADNIVWSFNAETGELRFEGEGAIPDYNDYTNDSGDIELKYPWKDVEYTSIVFSEGITGIGNYAFIYSKALKNVVIPDTVTALGKGIFLCCYELESAVLPSEVTEIGDSMFSACSSLKSITFGTKVEKIGKEAFYKCSALEEISFPETLKAIDEAAFHSTALKEAVLPEGFTTLGSRVFYSCEELGEIILPSTLAEIGTNAFDGCRALKEIVFPAALTKLPADVCSGCRGLKTVTLPESLVEIGDRAFNLCVALKEITIPASTTVIGDKALGYGSRGNKVDGFTINGYINSEPVVSYAENNGFAFNSIGYITSGTCGENATWEYNEEEKTLYINGTGAMADYSADDFVAYNLIPYENVVIAPEITKIGSYAFYNASAMNFTLLEKVEEIGEKAIGYYDNEGSPVLREGTSITSYDGLAPMVYAAENQITFNSLGEFIVTEGKLGDDITWTYDIDTKILAVSGTGSTYNYTAKELPGFADYDIQSIIVSDGITVLGDYVFCTVNAYCDITLGKAIEKIGTNAFGFIKTEMIDDEGNPTGVTAFIPNDILVVYGYISTPADEYAKFCEFTFEPLDGDVLPLFSLIVPSVIDHVKNFIIIYSETADTAPDAQAIMDAFPKQDYIEVIAPEVFGTGSEFTIVNENGTYTYKIVVRGDNTGDGKINSSDALAVLLHSVKQTVMEDDYLINASDINFDGIINSSDALSILQITVGINNSTDSYHPGIIR